jgi:thiol:disulfide interchange protein
MRLLSSLLLIPVFAAAPQRALAVQAEKEAAPAAKPDVYDEKADAHAQVDAAIARAKKENRRVLLQWGANWCGWCRLLHECMGKDEALAKELLYEYEVVLVDVGKADKNADLKQRFGAAVGTIPFLTILDGDGKVVVNQPTEPFELADKTKPGHDPKKLVDFLEQHKATPWVAADLRATALAAAKAEGKHVFLHYGAPWCGWCHRLEDWMARPEVAALLAKEFVELKIDTDRTVGGKEAIAADRRAAGLAPEGGIPWFLFLDADGKQLATSEAPKGNVGFPYEPPEVAWFASMLQTTSLHLTAADVDALKASLAAARKEIEAKRAPR